MTMPVTRTKVLIGKITAAIINCIIVLAVVIGSLYIFTLKYNPDQEFYRFLWLITITTGVFEAVFLSIGLFLASAVKRYKMSSGIGLGILFALYVLSVLVALSEKIDFLKYLTPFKYFEASKLLQNDSIEGKYLIISFVWIALFIFLTFKIYNNRDLRD
jgi:ABC-2 type transport system permease protein